MPDDITLNSDEERNQEETSEPCGPPQPVKRGSNFAEKAVMGTAVVVIGGAAFIMLGVATAPAMGATRSARIEWQERDAEVERAWHQLQNDSAKSEQPSASDTDASDD